MALAADCEDGRLLVKQIANMKSESVAVALQDWKSAGVGAIVWDGAKGHRGPEVRELGVKLISQPPGSPELNPMERLIEEVRRSIEGTVYGNLQSKVHAALGSIGGAFSRSGSDEKAGGMGLDCPSLPQPPASTGGCIGNWY